jgi:hypothetical protein
LSKQYKGIVRTYEVGELKESPIPRYRERLKLPAYGLYRKKKLIATVRAKDRSEAIKLFKDYMMGMKGDKVKRIA